MKLAHLFAVSALLFGLAGCTINHYHYGRTTDTAHRLRPNGDQYQARLGQQLQAIEAAIQIRADNIANTDTLGYKARQTRFVESDRMPQVTLDWTDGGAIYTNNDLDLYINGEGFFKVEILEEYGGGIAYSRVGNFFCNRDGEMVLGSADGPRLADGITIPDDAISLSVSADGMVSIVLPDNSVSQIGVIELHRFVSKESLQPIGRGLYVETDASGPAISSTPGEGAMGTIKQCMLEGSNVSLVQEYVELTKLVRWGEMIARQIDLPPLDVAIKLDLDAIKPNYTGKPGVDLVLTATSREAAH